MSRGRDWFGGVSGIDPQDYDHSPFKTCSKSRKGLHKSAFRQRSRSTHPPGVRDLGYS